MGIMCAYKYILPLPQRHYFGLNAASLAEAEELVSSSSGLVEQEANAAF